MLTDDKYLDLRGRRCVGFATEPKYPVFSNVTVVYLFTVWYVTDYSRKWRKEEDSGDKFLKDILLFCKQVLYYNDYIGMLERKQRTL